MKTAFLLVLLVFTPWTQAQDIAFSRGDLQKELQARMPLTQRTVFFDITLKEPKVALSELEQRIQVNTKVQVVTALGSEMSGEITASGKLRYKNISHSFYIDEPKIQSLKIEGLQDELQQQLHLIAQDLLLPVLSDQPVYQLKDDNVQEALAKMMLKSIRIKDDAVVASLSVF